MTKQKISSLQRQFWLENQHELKPNFFSFRIDTLLSEEKLIEFPSYSAALRGASFVAYYTEVIHMHVKRLPREGS